ncbi:MAG: extracellular solute-binding protein [Kiritimatiellaeota bacterium]|nr:extracellular solute-binding protein [Kiritimatiellota bacterium]
MLKNLAIVLLAAGVVALPFVFHRAPPQGEWRPGDPELIVVTPHNEAIRQEFAEGFSAWHHERYGKPVRVDWRVIGGTTEIMRYLAAEYGASARRFLRAQGHDWPANGAEIIFAAKPAPDGETLWRAFRASDAPDEISCQMDVFFGGGEYDHQKAQRQGLTVPAWKGGPPAGLFEDAEGRVLIPKAVNGEVWRGEAFYGTVLSAFGICYNKDRLADLGIAAPPRTWEDLADARYFGQLALADPTKSGSVAKAFEMIVHAQCAKAVAAAGFTREAIAAHEAAVKDAPPAYHAAIEQGWVDGVNLLRRIGANALYFSDSSSKVPVDVSMGVAAAGIAIDFMGRFQSEMSTPHGQEPVMEYVNPEAGSSMTADPLSLLRGAPSRELAVRFIEFVLGEDGQKLWNYKAGAPGGPRRFALRRLPIRRDFYPSADPVQHAIAEARREHLSDPLLQPDVDAYRLAEAFRYEPRWTTAHFGIQRDLVRCMCMDSAEELTAAWAVILRNGGPGANPEAMRHLEALPDAPLPLTWESAVGGYAKVPRMDILREWTAFFRRQYRIAEQEASKK